MNLNSITSLYILLFSVYWTTPVQGHIGEKCNSILQMCLPLNPHTYCDSGNICRCREDYPVIIKPHTCKRPKKVAEKCSHPLECTYSDKNSYCTQTPYSSVCSCRDGYSYDMLQSKCVLDSKASTTKRNPEALLLPSAIGFLFACFGLFCCFVFLWHSFCRKQRTVDWGRRMDTAIGLRPCNRSMVGDGSDLHGNRLSGHLPSFESAIFDQPPPSYEEAIKGNIHMSASSHSSSKDIVS